MRANANAIGGTVGGGADIAYDFHTSSWWIALTAEFGLSPVSIFRPQQGVGGMAAFGFVYEMNSVHDLTGSGIVASIPVSILHLLPRSFLPGRAWGALTQLAKNSSNTRWKHLSLAFGYAGPSYWQFALRNNSFASTASITGEFYPLSQFSSYQPLLYQAATSAIGKVQAIIGNTNYIISNLDDLSNLVTTLNN